MKKYNAIFLFLCIFVAVQSSQAQKTGKAIDFFAGEIIENDSKFTDGLPKGWMRSVDNSDCTINFEKGALYFERQSPDEKCSVTFTKEAVSNGKYVLTTAFKIDGNAVEVLVNGEPIKKKLQIEVKDGNLSVTIRTNSNGKAWGWINKMSLTKK